MPKHDILCVFPRLWLDTGRVQMGAVRAGFSTLAYRGKFKRKPDRVLIIARDPELGALFAVGE